jgi:hypothetical protein
MEIQELTFIIKQDIANINKQIAGLQSYVKQRNVHGHSGSPESKQIDEHNHNVVMLLQSKLANTSMGFKEVLEIRTQVSLSLCDDTSKIFKIMSPEYERVERPHRTVYVFHGFCSKSNTVESVLS